MIRIMNRAQVSLKNRELMSLSAKSRESIKLILTKKVLVPFLKQVKDKTDPMEILDIMESVLMNANFAEKITKVRIKQNKAKRFIKNYSREIKRLKKDYDQKDS